MLRAEMEIPNKKKTSKRQTKQHTLCFYPTDLILPILSSPKYTFQIRRANPVKKNHPLMPYQKWPTVLKVTIKAKQKFLKIPICLSLSNPVQRPNHYVKFKPQRG